MAVAGRVGVVFCIRAIGDNENLYILIQTATSPKAVPLVTVDLVERLFDGHTAPLQFHMNQRQTVYQNRDIIAVIIVAAILHILDVYKRQREICTYSYRPLPAQKLSRW